MYTLDKVIIVIYLNNMLSKLISNYWIKIKYLAVV